MIALCSSSFSIISISDTFHPLLYRGACTRGLWRATCSYSLSHCRFLWCLIVEATVTVANTTVTIAKKTTIQIRDAELTLSWPLRAMVGTTVGALGEQVVCILAYSKEQ